MRLKITKTFLTGIAAGVLMISSVVSADPPAESGIVTRGETPIALTFFDVDTGYRVILGADLTEYCMGVVNFDVVSFQDVNLSDERISVLVQGTVQAHVYDFLDFDCGLFLSVPPVASGDAHIVRHDNDINGNVSPNRANAWGTRAQGILMDADDANRVFILAFNAMFLRDGRFETRTMIQLN